MLPHVYILVAIWVYRASVRDVSERALGDGDTGFRSGGSWLSVKEKADRENKGKMHLPALLGHGNKDTERFFFLGIKSRRRIRLGDMPYFAL